MADNIPRHNRMSVDLANILGDPLSGADNGIKAAADGRIATADTRNRRLHEAYSWILEELIKREDGTARYDIEGLVSTQSFTFSSSGVALKKDFLVEISLGSSAIFQKRSKDELDRDTDIRINYGYAIENGLIYGYQRSAGTLTILNAGSGTLYYYRADRIDPTTGNDVAINTTPDMGIDRRWMSSCLHYAAYRIAQDKGAAEWLDKAKTFYAEAYMRLNG